MEQHWPQTLWIVRHGESAGNVAREAADAAGLGRIDIAERDVDVPLSDRGEEQSQALGDWFAEMPEDQRPEVVLTSPYLRARRTAEIVQSGGGLDSVRGAGERRAGQGSADAGAGARRAPPDPSHRG